MHIHTNIINNRVPPHCGCPEFPKWPWFDKFELPDMPPLPTIPLFNPLQLIDITNFSVKQLMKIINNLLDKIAAAGISVLNNAISLYESIKKYLKEQIASFKKQLGEAYDAIMEALDKCTDLEAIKKFLIKYGKKLGEFIALPFSALIAGLNALAMPNIPSLPEMFDKLCEILKVDILGGINKLIPDNFSIKGICDLLNKLVGKLLSIIPIPPTLPHPALPSISIVDLYTQIKKFVIETLDSLKDKIGDMYDSFMKELNEIFDLDKLQEFCKKMFDKLCDMITGLGEIPCKIFGKLLASISFTFDILKVLIIDIPAYLGLAVIDFANFSIKQLVKLFNDILKYIEKLYVIAIQGPIMFFMNPHIKLHSWMFDAGGNFNYIP